MNIRLLIVGLLSTLTVLHITHKAEAASCSDFSTQREAQDYYNNHNEGNLDRDQDGLACENLPVGYPTSNIEFGLTMDHYFPNVPEYCTLTALPGTLLYSGTQSGSQTMGSLPGGRLAYRDGTAVDNDGTGYLWVEVLSNHRYAWVMSDSIVCNE